MIVVSKIDENGYFVEDVIVKEGEEIPSDCIETRLDTTEKGYYRPRWTGTEWIEDMTEEQLDELNNQPREITEEQQRLLDLEMAITAILGGGM